MTRVKVCGVTRPDDARLAADLGAFAVGMILSRRGPRFLERDRAVAVRAAIPAGVLAVGVFADEDLANVNALARELSLDLVQLHGNESPSMLERLEKPALKALLVGDVTPSIDAWRGTWGVLLEGTQRGRPFDWKLARDLRAERLLLAGGLTPENVSRAIAAVSPWAVDVASGVESAPGVKDRAKLEAFFRASSGDAPRGSARP